MKKIIFHNSKFFLNTYIVLGTCFSFSQPVTFSYTGVAQTYTVGACVYTIAVDVKGAEGTPAGPGGASIAGKGGRVQATITVTPGEVLNIYVGGIPVNATVGGWNGGGTGGASAGSGGGASDIRQGGTAFSNRIIVAGGGGGGGYQISNGDPGGNGGGTTGANGMTAGPGGQGGSQTSGGAGGTGTNPGTNGTLGTGGNGGGTYGGGGGGGYYGGGGGSAPAAYGGGGGGGSSYVVPAATGVTHTQGFQTGNGQIIINPIVSTGPAAPGSITGYNSACAGVSATYSISSVPTATTYSWTVPSGTTINSGQTTTAISVTFASSSGNISVIASNSCGTSPASTMSVTVTANLPVSAGNDETLCNGQSATLTATGGTNYLWSTGETTTIITVSPSASTNYTVSASDASGCSGTDEVMVTVNSLPPANAGNDVTICTGQSATLTASGGTNYLWSTGGTDASIVVSPSAATTYSVTATNASGCSASDSVTVTVDSCATGIFFSASNQNNIISPNPTTGKFQVSSFSARSPSDKFQVEIIEIYNVMGEKILYSNSLPSGGLGWAFDISSYPAGIYFVKVIAEEEIFLSKIIKR